MPSRALKQLARKGLRQLCRLGLWARSRPIQFSTADQILILAPHSDDETLGCGALIADFAARGHAIHVAYFTDSAGSHRKNPEISVERLAAQRQAEATDAMRLAGIPADRLHWLGAPDGRLKDLSPEKRTHWEQRLRELFTQLRPTAILLPSRTDGSSEHVAMFHLVAAVVPTLAARPRLLEFPVWSWWNPRFLWPQVHSAGRIWRHSTARQSATKRAMLARYQSQVRVLPPASEPALSAEFLAAFSTSHEFFFETNLSP